MRAAIAYPDGHCVPLHRAGRLWTTDRGVASHDEGFVIAEGATGFAAGDWTPTSGRTAELVLAPARTIAGSCSKPHLAVELVNPYQRLVARAGTGGAFRFAGVLGMPARVTCRDSSGALIEELAYDPETGFSDNAYSFGRATMRACRSRSSMRMAQRSPAHESRSRIATSAVTSIPPTRTVANASAVRS